MFVICRVKIKKIRHMFLETSHMQLYMEMYRNHQWGPDLHFILSSSTFQIDLVYHRAHQKRRMDYILENHGKGMSNLFHIKVLNLIVRRYAKGFNCCSLLLWAWMGVWSSMTSSRRRTVARRVRCRYAGSWSTMMVRTGIKVSTSSITCSFWRYNSLSIRVFFLFLDIRQIWSIRTRKEILL